MQSPELVLCNKTQRVTIFKLPPLSTTKGYYLDDWKDMIWEGGVKVTEKNRVIKISFVDKHGKVFGETKVPENYKEAIVKTNDSSRGYAVRLQNPKGGYVWVGVAFRDRNDAFDFGVAFQDQSSRNQVNQAKLHEQFSNNMDFGLKKGEKVKINIGGGKKEQKPSQFSNANNPFDFDFGSSSTNQAQKAPQSNEWADFDFGTSNKPSNQNTGNKGSNNSNLLDFD